MGHGMCDGVLYKGDSSAYKFCMALSEFEMIQKQGDEIEKLEYNPKVYGSRTNDTV